MKNIGTVAVALSGGVDSAVAAALLQRKGYAVLGVIMAIYDESMSLPIVEAHACFGPSEKEDLEDASVIAKKLNIPLVILDLKDEYRQKVLNKTIIEYQQGHTPNPCIKCNRELKFGAIMNELQRQGKNFDYFATGHYVRNEYDEHHQSYMLKKALDASKDQSYFLYYLPREKLSKLLFPLGELAKGEVRRLAEELALPVSDKPESQDFIEGGYQQLFKGNAKPGPILNEQGVVIGEHPGIVYYTIGQRRGIGVSSPNPLYVISKDSKTNTITVGAKENLLAKGLLAGDFNWFIDEKQPHALKVKARIRYNQVEVDAEVFSLPGNTIGVEFDAPQMAVTPGQSVVIYKDDIVWGGGIIRKELKNGVKSEIK